MVVGIMEINKVGVEGGVDISREFFFVVVREVDELSWYLN